MKAMVPALTPLLRSNTQGDLLALLFLDPERELTLTDLHRHTGANASVVHREIERLSTAGVVRDRRIGRTRLVRANTAYELFRPLSEIVLHSYGPLALLSELLEPISGIAEAYIYGSWAARYQGEQGLPPQDVDVLAIGEAPRAILERLSQQVRETVRKEVNITRITTIAWEESSSPFLKTLRARPLVRIPSSRGEGS